MVWNDAIADGALWAGGGGASVLFGKPSWQVAPGVPNDNARDMPDIALAASFNHDGYYVYRSGAGYITGGTSASAPTFAGVVPLLNLVGLLQVPSGLILGDYPLIVKIGGVASNPAMITVAGP